ncbi:DUF4255 domain-containing protein [Glaciimonas sp. PAMC28666]|uniref:DUF4255 domain-containing protein n=1 Tax=Glaciimonas sp. PAMC28666 TaxID=2807626 RepID=UPI0019636491|nr:DUF4255 domain-containing protein [Glaciimonas sp. PAMC28666]QRX82511.1 DUF4255 domain-containing protein [Glaciimonas sp. PAMC28666]
MIEKTLTFIAAELNNFLGARYPSNEALSIVSGLINPDGSTPPGIDNRIVFSLVNIEREPAVAGAGVVPRSDGGYALQQAPLHLNLYVLLTASFADYTQALQLLSMALGYFQSRTYFDAQSSPAFPRELDRLQLELVSLSIHEMNNLFSLLGSKYQPSALYKVRMLTIQENWMTASIPAVSATDTRIASRNG